MPTSTTTSTSSPAINFSGLASGIDTSGVITAMTKQEQKAIDQVQSKIDTENTQLTAWQQVNANLAGLQLAAQSLTLQTTYNAAQGTSSNAAVASVTAQPGATTGDHALTVTTLAQAQKIVSGTFSSGSAALGLSGSFTLNGKTVTLAASDALNDVAVKINAAGAGAQASVVNVGPNDYRITLAATQTGAANALSMADNGAGTILSSMHLISGAASIRQAITTATKSGAGSLGLSSATQTVANVLGAASGSAASGTVQINGTGVAIDLNKDSLNDIASKINAANITGVSAQVVGLTDANGHVAKQQLQILSSNQSGTPAAPVAPTLTDSNNVLATLGVLQSGAAHQITGAQDAKFNLDGLDMTRSSNVIGDILPGVSFKLLSQGTSGSPATTILSVTQNTDSVVSAVKSFTSAFNTIQDFVNNQNQFTPPNGAQNSLDNSANASPPLFGDSTLTGIQSQLNLALGVVSGKNTLGSVGITLDTNGHLNVDSAQLTQALQNDPKAVSNLFGLAGTTDDSSVQFVAASAKTKASTGGGYAVNITQAATQAALGASTAQSGLSAQPETLTFGGMLFPSATNLTLTAGNSLQDTVDQINNNSSLAGKIYASIDSGGKLAIKSVQYGSASGFTVNSNIAAATTNSGIGTTLLSSVGQNVAGTINGEPATGKGRTLTGSVGNSTTEGVQLLVSATAPGSYGHVKVTHGVADSIISAITSITDPVNGAVVGAENSINSQITDAQTQITTLQTEMDTYTQYLQQMFSDMETRVSALQSQASAFAAQVAGLTGTSSSSTKKNS